MPNQEQQLKQILAQVIEEHSGNQLLTEQAIKALFNNKFEETNITESEETWQQLDKILREKSYKEFIKSNNDKDYTALVALVIIKKNEKYTPNYVFSTPEASQLKAGSDRSIS